jgi:hypothetical protein
VGRSEAFTFGAPKHPTMLHHIRLSLKAITLVAGSFLFTVDTQAQVEPKTKDGSVFAITMVRTGANSEQDYLNSLTEFYIPSMEAAKAQGLILSYRLLQGNFSTEDDFNVMLMVEHANLAALDPDPAREAKWKAIRDEITAKLGGEEKLKTLRNGMNDLRIFHGEKLMRTVLLK